MIMNEEPDVFKMFVHFYRICFTKFKILVIKLFANSGGIKSIQSETRPL